MSDHKKNRRDFLKSSSTIVGAAAFTPYFFSNSPIGMAAAVRCKNDRINIGLIGAGGMGNGNIKSAKAWVDLVAIADVDSGRRNQTNKNLSGGKADVYEDYRKVIERDDIDVIHVATPDHWHTKPLIEAMLAGKNVYCEKPMTLTIDEGKLIRKVQKETGRIIQVGTQQRSQFKLFTKAMAIVREGRLGKIKEIQCAIGGAPNSPEIPVAEAPKELNWEKWLGPAPKTEYRYFRGVDKNGKKKKPNTNGHYEFRWWYEYSGGKLTDWGAHHVDIAVWALTNAGQSTAAVSIDGTADHPVEFKDGIAVQKDRYNTATSFKFDVMMADGTKLIIRNDTDNGVLITGEKGRIFVNRRKLVGKPVEELADNPLKADTLGKVYKGLPMEGDGRGAHWANFLHCSRENLEPISDVHSHMKMLNICHLAGISGRLGRGLKWDDKTEQIVGDDVANAMLAREYREGYAIEMAMAGAK